MLESTWLRLMKNLEFPENRDTYQLLIDAYSKSGRHYHNVDHLRSVLRCLNDYACLANKQHEVEIALWFHDSVYKPFSKSNEAESARWALSFLRKNGASVKMQQHVCDLIIATIHSNQPKSNDERLIVDIDLSILGADEYDYDKFAKGVRQEYRKIPLFIYRRKRKEILSGFLSRERIYFFDSFFEIYEILARGNIEREINNL